MKLDISKFDIWLTKTQIKIENAVSKSFLLHDYIGSWIAILSLLLVLIFDFNIYIVVVNPIIAGITKELFDKFIRKVKPELMDFISTAIKGVVLYILLLLLGY